MSAADALPAYDIRTLYGVRVDAPPERMLAAAFSVTSAEAPLLRRLFRLRGLRAAADAPIWEAMRAEGFVEYDGETLVAIGRPWKVRGDVRTLDHSLLQRQFSAFDEPGWAKLAMDIRAGDGRLVTETRVLLTDDRARSAFRRYWRVIAPFSGLVRRSWLQAAKRRAEAEQSEALVTTRWADPG